MNTPTDERKFHAMKYADLKSIRQWAEITGIGAAALYEAVKEGRLAAIRLSAGRNAKLLISEADLTEWLESCRVEAVR
jgi:excisionase family DNA binding protein